MKIDIPFVGFLLFACIGVISSAYFSIFDRSIFEGVGGNVGSIITGIIVYFCLKAIIEKPKTEAVK